jgi:hypothetical protein
MIGDFSERILVPLPGGVDEEQAATIAFGQPVDHVAGEIEFRRNAPLESSRLRHARGFAGRPDAPAAMEFDAARVLRASRLRFGNVRAMGVPAILIGVAGVILAVGASRSLGTIAPMLPETLREMKSLVEAGRDARSLKG